MTLYILRGLFILLVTAVTALYVLPLQADERLDFSTTASTLLLATCLAVIIVAVDAFNPRKRLSSISGVFLGLGAGLLAAYAFSFVVDLFALILYPSALETTGSLHNVLQGAKVLIGLITCYIGMSLVMQTKDDFRFVIPYVEFAKQIRGARPILLDTSVIIDGRILDIVKTRFIQGNLVVPKFVLIELQTVADSADKIKRARGRRGLDILNKLQNDSQAGVSVAEADVEGVGVDQKLMTMAGENNSRIMTNDFNLAKVAQLRGIEVLNLNDLAGALRPVVLPGEDMHVKIIKPGENPTQGVGYLEDGTMVVVENGRAAIGHEIAVTVTSTLQTSAGRMIFGRANGNGGQGHGGQGNGGQGHPTSDDNRETTNAAPPSIEDRAQSQPSLPGAAAPSQPATPDSSQSPSGGDSAGRASQRSNIGRNPRRLR